MCPVNDELIVSAKINSDLKFSTLLVKLDSADRLASVSRSHRCRGASRCRREEDNGLFYSVPIRPVRLLASGISNVFFLEI